MKRRNLKNPNHFYPFSLRSEMIGDFEAETSNSWRRLRKPGKSRKEAFRPSANLGGFLAFIVHKAKFLVQKAKIR